MRLRDTMRVDSAPTTTTTTHVESTLAAPMQVNIYCFACLGSARFVNAFAFVVVVVLSDAEAEAEANAEQRARFYEAARQRYQVGRSVSLLLLLLFIKINFFNNMCL